MSLCYGTFQIRYMRVNLEFAYFSLKCKIFSGFVLTHLDLTNVIKQIFPLEKLKYIKEDT